MPRQEAYYARLIQPIQEEMTVILKKEFRELLLEMTLAYLVDQPENVIEFAIKFLSEKKLERLGVYEEFQKPLTKSSVATTRRFSVLAEPIVLDYEEYQPVSYPKTESQRDKLRASLDRAMFFHHLGDSERKMVIGAMKMRNVAKGEVVIKQGARGDLFYVVEKGVFEAKQDESITLKTYTNSGYFGELSLMYNTPTACSVVAKSDGVLWTLDRNTFRRVVLKCSYQKRKMYEMLIDNVPMLSVLSDRERSNLADSLVSKCFSDGECIIRQGDEADGMYFVMSGIVKVSKKGHDGRSYELKQLSSGDYFGELALITYKKRAASVHAVGPVKAAFLNVEAFERLLGRCIDVMKRNITDYEKQLAHLARAEVHTTDFR